MNAPNPQAAVQVQSVRKSFGAQHVLDSVDLEVAQGETLAILGQSGTGKSVLLKLIIGLQQPDAGSIRIHGQEVAGLALRPLNELRQKIGFVFQSFNLLSRTSALENVELPLMYNRKISSQIMREKAMHALESVGLADRSHHMPNQMSGGEQQRVAIARALVNDPVVILADEPTGNLDTRTSVEVMEIFQNLNAKGITVVIVTHEPDIASFTKVNVIFKDGRIQKVIGVENQKNAREELNHLPVIAEEDAL